MGPEDGPAPRDRVVLSTPDGERVPEDSWWPDVLVRDGDGDDVPLAEGTGNPERTYAVPPSIQVPPARRRC